MLHHGEIIQGYSAVFRGETDAEVTRQGREHAERDDGIQQHPLEKVGEVKSEIRGG